MHLGDSRAYYCPAGQAVEPVTADEAVDGRLLQSLGGITEEVRPHVWSRSVRPGDRVVLASDGLWSRMDDRIVPALLAGTARLRPEQAVGVLIDTALAAGGDDNVTVVVAEIAGRGDDQRVDRG